MCKFEQAYLCLTNRQLFEEIADLIGKENTMDAGFPVFNKGFTGQRLYELFKKIKLETGKQTGLKPGRNGECKG